MDLTATLMKVGKGPIGHSETYKLDPPFDSPQGKVTYVLAIKTHGTYSSTNIWACTSRGKILIDKSLIAKDGKSIVELLNELGYKTILHK